MTTGRRKAAQRTAWTQAGERTETHQQTAETHQQAAETRAAAVAAEVEAEDEAEAEAAARAVLKRRTQDDRYLSPLPVTTTTPAAGLARRL